MTVVATDDFNRANGAIGANWTTHGGYTTPQISGNAIVSAAGVDYAATYSAANAGSDDMYVQVSATLTTPDAHNDMIVVCRMPNDATETGYVGDTPSYGSILWTLSRATNGVFTNLASGPAGFGVAGTSTLQVQAVGTTIKLLQNATTLATVTDATHSGSAKRYGGAHIYSDNTGYCSIDNFEVGNFAAATAKAPPPPVPRPVRSLMRRR